MIDGHAHACGRLRTADGIEVYLKENNLESIVLCGGESGSRRNYPYPPLSDIIAEERARSFINNMITKVTGLKGFADHFDEENRHVRDLAEQLPGRVYAAYWANPLEEDCIEKMQYFFEQYSFSMIKLHQCWTAFDIGSKTCEGLFQWAADHRVPVFIHVSDRHQAGRLAAMANRFCHTSIIVAHMLWAKEIHDELEYDNVWFDLSSPQLYSIETMQYIVDSCGARRLIMGSDTPYGFHNIQLILKRLERLALSEQQKNLITGQNLLHLLAENEKLLNDKTK
ncbi:MAG: amidohydrolase family protein [Lachnospiraceae bacterium]